MTNSESHRLPPSLRSAHLFARTSAEELADLLARYGDELKPACRQDPEAAAETQDRACIRDFGRRFVSISCGGVVVEQTTSR